MQRTNGLVIASLLLVVSSRALFAACPVERGSVKTATDAQAAEVRLAPIPTTIEVLHTFPSPRPLPQEARIGPVEMTIYSVTATLIAYRVTADSEVVLILSDHARRTILAKIPAPACTSGSRFGVNIADARATFDRRYAATDTFQEVRQPVEIQGIGFFDFYRTERGIAPNAISLYPVTSIDFTPPFEPQAPAPAGRRRAVGGGSRSCPRPALTLTASRTSACATDPVTIAWQASQGARVTIDGIGTSLPSSGNRVVNVSASTAYSGRASTSCGTSDDAVAVVTFKAETTASISGPSTVNTGTTATLSVLMSHATAWRLTSSLGNSISPSEGASSRNVSYAANRTGSDTITLLATGGGCGPATATHMIFVNTPPPPGGGGGGLRCCDGTRSPTCFDCSKKQGCCSGHGGVCGCP